MNFRINFLPDASFFTPLSCARMRREDQEKFQQIFDLISLVFYFTGLQHQKLMMRGDRALMQTKTTDYVIHILVMPDFNLASTMAFVDPFRVTNYQEGRALYRWRFLSDQGGLIRSNNGGAVETERLDPKARADLLIVTASGDPAAHLPARVSDALRNAARTQSTLGGLDTGAFLLAQAGLLHGYRATVHYEHIGAFQERFPDVDVLESLWVLDGPRVTCCGGAASTEFALHMVRSMHGPALANAVARHVFSQALRDHNAPQNPQHSAALGATVPDTVRRAVKVMEKNLEITLRISEVCAAVGVSHRQLNRLFAQFVGKTPALYYRDIRLDRAREMITETSLSMAEIACASGFSSQVHFSRAYRDRFGLPPTRDRIKGRVPFAFQGRPLNGEMRE